MYQRLIRLNTFEAKWIPRLVPNRNRYSHSFTSECKNRLLNGMRHRLLRDMQNANHCRLPTKAIPSAQILLCAKVCIRNRHWSTANLVSRSSARLLNVCICHRRHVCCMQYASRRTEQKRGQLLHARPAMHMRWLLRRRMASNRNNCAHYARSRHRWGICLCENILTTLLAGAFIRFTFHAMRCSTLVYLAVTKFCYWICLKSTMLCWMRDVCVLRWRGRRSMWVASFCSVYIRVGQFVALCRHSGCQPAVWGFDGIAVLHSFVMQSMLNEFERKLEWFGIIWHE